MIAPRIRRMISRRSKLPGSLVTVAACAALLAMMGGSVSMIAETPEQQAWEMLRSGAGQKNAGKRVQAVRALRLLPGDPEAEEMAEAALRDRKPEVRTAAATALGLMGAKEAIPALKSVLSDKKPAVVLAAAHSLETLNDPSGYQVYYELLTGERKASESLIAEQMEMLEDRKKMAELAFNEGIGFLPFADMGYSAVKTIRKHDASPVRASAARALIKDSDPLIDHALVRATSDKNSMVRASALLAIAKRDEPDLLPAIVSAMSDKNRTVRFTAAAAVIRLTTVTARNKDTKDASRLLGSKSTDPGCINALSVRKTAMTTN